MYFFNDLYCFLVTTQKTNNKMVALCGIFTRSIHMSFIVFSIVKILMLICLLLPYCSTFYTKTKRPIVVGCIIYSVHTLTKQQDVLRVVEMSSHFAVFYQKNLVEDEPKDTHPPKVTLTKHLIK